MEVLCRPISIRTMLLQLGIVPSVTLYPTDTADVYLKPGTVIYVGNIASQEGFWVGGGIQIYVPK
jgi:hypothetical protein